jgi:hypothetical protein
MFRIGALNLDGCRDTNNGNLRAYASAAYKFEETSQKPRIDKTNNFSMTSSKFGTSVFKTLGANSL